MSQGRGRPVGAMRIDAVELASLIGAGERKVPRRLQGVSQATIRPSDAKARLTPVGVKDTPRPQDDSLGRDGVGPVPAISAGQRLR